MYLNTKIKDDCHTKENKWRAVLLLLIYTTHKTEFYKAPRTTPFSLKHIYNFILKKFPAPFPSYLEALDKINTYIKKAEVIGCEWLSDKEIITLAQNSYIFAVENSFRDAKVCKLMKNVLLSLGDRGICIHCGYNGPMPHVYEYSSDVLWRETIVCYKCHSWGQHGGGTLIGANLPFAFLDLYRQFNIITEYYIQLQIHRICLTMLTSHLPCLTIEDLKKQLIKVLKKMTSCEDLPIKNFDLITDNQTHDSKKYLSHIKNRDFEVAVSQKIESAIANMISQNKENIYEGSW